MSDAIVAGHLCIDIIPTILETTIIPIEDLLQPGRLNEVGGLVLATGGAVSNTGLAMARLGMDVRLVARIGDDLIGSMTRQIIQEHGETLVQDLYVAHGEPSSYTIAISPPGRDRTFLHCPGTNNTFAADDVPDDLIAQTRLLHFGYPPLMRRMYMNGGSELTKLMRRAKSAGATTSLDMAMPDPAQESGRVDWRRLLENALPYTDVFVPSAEELFLMLDRDGYQAARSHARDGSVVRAMTPDQVACLAQGAIDLGASIVALKLGDRGLYLRSADTLANLGRGKPPDVAIWQDRELWVPCFRVNVVSTVGSGDATVAGLLAGILRGQTPERAVTTAVAVGACNVEAADATSGVRDWDQTERRISAGWAQREANMPHEDWLWDEESRLWRGPNDSGKK